MDKNYDLILVKKSGEIFNYDKFVNVDDDDEDSVGCGFWISKDGKIPLDSYHLDFSSNPFTVIASVGAKLFLCINQYCGTGIAAEESEKNLSYLSDLMKKYVPGFGGFEIWNYRQEVSFRDSSGNEYNPYFKGIKKERTDEETKYFIEVGGKIIPLIEEVISKPYLGNSDEEIKKFIDRFLKSEGITLEDFIFDSKYIYVLNPYGDKEWNNFYNSGLVAKDRIEKIFSD